jgi:uncharacterized protein (TIGR02246 family)
MRNLFWIPLCCGIVIGMGLIHFMMAPLAQSRAAEEQKVSPEVKDLDTLKASASAFEQAYNAADAKAIAAQFTENGEIVDEEGNVTEGRMKIEARFAELFKEYPKAHIVVELTSLRQLSPEVAVEEGYSTTTLSPDEPGFRSPYTIVHVKRNGQWLAASVRDFPEEIAIATAHNQLESLNWLIGHWVDESIDGRVETTCQWSEDGNYLLQDYVVKARRGVLRGTQRIAWDPLRNTIRSWAFDDSGAFTEATWTPIEDAWILKVEGVTPDGRGASATRFVTPISGDAFQIDSSNVVVGSELLPDSSVRVVRRPPTPAS